MTFEKLKEEINKRTTHCDVVFESDIALDLLNVYGEKLTFYANGYVKSYGDCRFLLDELGYDLNCDDATLESIGFTGIIRQWNKEEKCGYWKVPV